MSFNLTLGLNTKLSKDVIISILGNAWPLSVKEIYGMAASQHGLNVTYQAIYKSVLELENLGVLEKEGKKFKLSGKWIHEQKHFLQLIENNYSPAKKVKLDFSKQTPITVKFDDYTVFVRTMANWCADKVLVGNGPNILIGIVRHQWWTATSFNFNDFELLKRMSKNIPKIYGLAELNGPLDNWIKILFEQGGMTGVKNGVNSLKIKDDLAIHGDAIVQVKFSPETRKFQDELYQRNKNLQDLFTEYARQAFEKNKVNIQVNITQNPELAEALRKQYLKYFEK